MSAPSGGLTRSELGVALVAMGVQSVGIIDLVILGPLGPALVQDFDRDLAWFASTILAFTVGSAVANVLGANVVDRFDRKRTLLFVLAGFAAAQAVCALSGSASGFLAGRVFGGMCAGLFSSTVNALVADAVDPSRRGRANGVVSAAYALAFIVGVPAGLFLAEAGSWRAPFWSMSALCALLMVAAAATLRASVPAPTTARSWSALPEVVADPRRLRSLYVNAALMFSAYAVTPFLADAVVEDLGYQTADLPGFYLVGGVVTLLAAVATGVYADRKGALAALRLTVAVSLPGTLYAVVMGNYGWAATVVGITAFMAPVTARTVPANTLAMAAVPERLRGAMMSLTSAFSQLGLGLGAACAGWVLEAGLPGLPGLAWCGVFSAAVALSAAFLAPAPAPAAS